LLPLTRPEASLVGVQATVHRFEPATGTGSVLTDDGLVLPFDAEAFAASTLRHLRTGQRVSVEVEGQDDAAHVVELWLESVGAVPRPPGHP
jgi:cold shock CspA family protein